MKAAKTLVAILSLILLLCSCNSDSPSVNVANTDKKASVSFGDSKSVTAIVSPIDKEALYWKYAAQMVVQDSSENGGQTDSYDEAGAVFIHEDSAGLSGTVDGFSVGTWNFLLFGYSRSGSEGNYTYSLVANGEFKGKVLIDDGVNIVVVPVLPVSDSSHGNGTLFVNTANISFIPKQTDTTGIETFTAKVFVNDVLQETTSISKAPGAYTVKVQFVHTYNSVEYVLAEGTVTATVYSNLTTTVTGSLNELATYVQFDANSAYHGMPTGTLSKSQDSGTGKWTITFTNTNPASVPTSYAWYVNGVVQSGEIGTSFVYTPGFESANITCVFGNSSGTGSASVYIN